ncbi:MAG TPA: hypothetical protein VK427_22620 [Kofleriaceae bacterium]|nr:hypothetical protein [Kofleriaceae bacterium]
MSGTPGAPGPYHDLANSKLGAQEAEGRAIAAAGAGKATSGTSEQKAEGEKKKELPTFTEWFNGRFWTEHVIAQDNKPSEVESKQSIMKIHLEPMFGSKRLDEIDIGSINRFRATCRGSGPFATLFFGTANDVSGGHTTCTPWTRSR